MAKKLLEIDKKKVKEAVLLITDTLQTNGIKMHHGAAAMRAILATLSTQGINVLMTTEGSK